MSVSEEYQIVERIKEYIKNAKPPRYHYIMLRNERILYIGDYFGMVSTGKITPQDAYVYIRTYRPPYKADFYYPFLQFYEDLLFAYLSKLGFHDEFFTAPATGLKYIVHAERYEDYLSIELLNLDTVVNNTNLRTIVFEVLGDKLVSGEKMLTDKVYRKIRDMFKSQKLFAGHNFSGAWYIIHEYYDEGNKSLVKEVARIAMDYERIFQPYRTCYDTRTWKEIDCSSINLD